MSLALLFNTADEEVTTPSAPAVEDTGRMFLAYGNYADGSTISGGGWLETLPLTNLKDRLQAKVARSEDELSGALSTASGVVFYGTLEGYLKAVDAKTGKELWKFKTPSGIIGNVNAYEHDGKEYIAVLSGVGGWAGIGLAAGLTKPTDGLGAVGGYAALSNYTALGGQLTVFALPNE